MLYCNNNMDFKKIYFYFKNSNFKRLLHVIQKIHFEYHKTANSRKQFTYLCYKVLIKNLKSQMTSQKVSLWDINIALWVIFLFTAMKIFSGVKNATGITSQWLEFLCGFRQTYSH